MEKFARSVGVGTYIPKVGIIESFASKQSMTLGLAGNNSKFGMSCMPRIGTVLHPNLCRADRHRVPAISIQIQTHVFAPAIIIRSGNCKVNLSRKMRSLIA